MDFPSRKSVRKKPGSIAVACTPSGASSADSASVSSGKLLPWEHQGEDGVSLREVPAVFTTNDVEAELHAVLDGVGIGQLPTYLVAAAIREGRLLHLLPRHTTERMGLYLYYPQRSHQPARVRAFIDFVSERLQSRDRFHLLRR
ncbi:MAG: hypothetical protein EPO12_15410 [Aquabacterium sp.]|nr:MAG: hypothetical protein EPO12_15410 [Aquabacterium sp.]